VSHTPPSKIRLEFKDVNAWEKHGYLEGQVYTVKIKEWKKEINMIED
jgi:hypothetical protein